MTNMVPTEIESKGKDECKGFNSHIINSEKIQIYFAEETSLFLIFEAKNSTFLKKEDWTLYDTI